MNGICLLIEGAPTDEISPEFLTAVMDVAEEHGLSPEGISIINRDSGEEVRR